MGLQVSSLLISYLHPFARWAPVVNSVALVLPHPIVLLLGGSSPSFVSWSLQIEVTFGTLPQTLIGGQPWVAVCGFTFPHQWIYQQLRFLSSSSVIHSATVDYWAAMPLMLQSWEGCPRKKHLMVSRGFFKPAICSSAPKKEDRGHNAGPKSRMSGVCRRASFLYLVNLHQSFHSGSCQHRS